jgi:hypothetical protein
VRVLHGRVRAAAVPAALAVIVMLAYCGWALAVPAFIALAAGWRSGRRRRLELAASVTPPAQGAAHRECRPAA